MHYLVVPILIYIGYRAGREVGRVEGLLEATNDLLDKTRDNIQDMRDKADLLEKELRG